MKQLLNNLFSGIILVSSICSGPLKDKFLRELKVMLPDHTSLSLENWREWNNLSSTWFFFLHLQLFGGVLPILPQSMMALWGTPVPIRVLMVLFCSLKQWSWTIVVMVCLLITIWNYWESQKLMVIVYICSCLFWHSVLPWKNTIIQY